MLTQQAASLLVKICWSVFVLVWLLASVFTKRTQVRSSVRDTLSYFIPSLAGWLLLLSSPRMPPPWGSLLLPRSQGLLALVMLLSVCGLAVCLAARWQLGRNWSGLVVRKQDHELVRTGVYGLVRHPIYAGLLMMFLGLVMLYDRAPGYLGFAFVLLAFWIKLRMEERVMEQLFGQAYADYSVRVRRLVPFLF